MSKKGKKEKKGIAGLMLFLGWMIFVLLAVVFYFYFFSDLDLRMFNKDKATQTDAQTSDQVGFTYETNANLDINSLIIEYYAALAVCDQEKLKSYVTDPSQFDDMTVYQQRSAVVKAYSNINCYTMPGYTEDATLVYVTSNLSLANITSVPLNINRFYVIKTAEGYKIDNSALSQEVNNYIETQSQSTDIQNLYKAVQDNVNSCIANDSAFAEFYNTVSSEQEQLNKIGLLLVNRPIIISLDFTENHQNLLHHPHHLQHGHQYREVVRELRIRSVFLYFRIFGVDQ